MGSLFDLRRTEYGSAAFSAIASRNCARLSCEITLVFVNHRRFGSIRATGASRDSSGNISQPRAKQRSGGGDEAVSVSSKRRTVFGSPGAQLENDGVTSSTARDLLDNLSLGIPARSVVLANIQRPYPLGIAIKVLALNLDIIHAARLALSGETVPFLLAGTHDGSESSSRGGIEAWGGLGWLVRAWLRPGKIGWLVKQVEGKRSLGALSKKFYSAAAPPIFFDSARV